MYKSDYPTYLVHFNKNHDPKNGQFADGDGDGDGKIDERHHNWSEKKKERVAARNKKFIDKEIAFQNRKIAGLKEKKKSYDKSIADIKKSGLSELKKAGYNDKTANEAINKVIKSRQTESDWIDYQIKNLEKYNKTLADIDVSSYTRRQVYDLYTDLGNKTLDEINSFDTKYKGKTLTV